MLDVNNLELLSEKLENWVNLVGEPITPLETQLRIKFTMHDCSQLSG